MARDSLALPPKSTHVLVCLVHRPCFRTIRAQKGSPITYCRNEADARRMDIGTVLVWACISPI